MTDKRALVAWIAMRDACYLHAKRNADVKRKPDTPEGVLWAAVSEIEKGAQAVAVREAVLHYCEQTRLW